MPCPMSPAPMTAMRACDTSFTIVPARRIAAVGVEDMPGIEIGCLRREEQQRSGEVLRLAEPALRHAGEESGAHGLAALVVGEHPFGQRRAENGGAERVDRDAGHAEFAAERLGDAVDGRLRRAISGVTGGVAEETARRGHQDDLAAAALL